MFKQKVVDLKVFKKEAKRRERIKKAKAMFINGASFVKDNWFWLSVLGAGGIAVGKKALAMHRVKSEIRFKQRTIYDRSLGRYVELKRPLTSKQSLEIERRRADGEKLHSILDDMGVLKR